MTSIRPVLVFLYYQLLSLTVHFLAESLKHGVPNIFGKLHPSIVLFSYDKKCSESFKINIALWVEKIICVRRSFGIPVLL